MSAINSRDYRILVYKPKRCQYDDRFISVLSDGVRGWLVHKDERLPLTLNESTGRTFVVDEGWSLVSVSKFLRQAGIPLLSIDGYRITTSEWVYLHLAYTEHSKQWALCQFHTKLKYQEFVRKELGDAEEVYLQSKAAKESRKPRVPIQIPVQVMPGWEVFDVVR